MLYGKVNSRTNLYLFLIYFQEKKPEQAKKSKKDENGAEDDEEVDDENEEAEDEEYELNYGEDIDGEGKNLLASCDSVQILIVHRFIICR